MPVLIIGIQYLKTLLQAGFFPMQPEKSMCQSVKCSYPHASCWNIDYFLNTFLHFSCSFVGESDSNNVLRCDGIHGNQPSNSVNQYPCFSATSSCHNHYRLVATGHRFFLWFIQAIENMFSFHGTILSLSVF